MMVDQIMELHPAVQYFHIGADEVNLLECEAQIDKSALSDRWL